MLIRRFKILAPLLVYGLPGLACDPAVARRDAPLGESGVTILQMYGDDITALSDVQTVALGPRGALAVVDGPPSRVLLFKQDGRVIPIGGPGAGPSEYGFIAELGFISDTLWISDPRNSKALFFGLDGDFIRDERVSVPGQGPEGRPAGPVRPLADGSWLASTAGVPVSGAVTGRTPFKPFVRVRGDELQDTVYMQALPAGDFLQVELGPGRFLQGLHPMPQRAIFEPDHAGRGAWVVDRRAAEDAESSSFLVHRLDLHGDTVWSLPIAYSPIRLTDSWASEWYEARARDFADRVPVPIGRLSDAFREAAPFPRFFPPIVEARAGAGGRLWLRESSPDTLRAHWLVLSSNGEVEGWLRAPSGFRLLDASATEVVGVVRDELDVQTVVRGSYSLEPIPVMN